MSSIKAWIGAARLRTLPLSVSGVIMGALLGFKAINPGCITFFSSKDSCVSNNTIWTSGLFWLAIATTIGFQVISNFANDYGDGVKGTDDDREGEQRAVASGLISATQMKRGVIVTSVTSLVLATWLIYVAFKHEDWILSFTFFLLGLASIAAAIKYTVGENAYGYIGLGDLFVFLFFGIVSVLGSYFLYTKQINWELLLPATSVGLFSIAVLNLNNMRDIEKDALHNKITLAVKLGKVKVKKYHYLLLVSGMLCAILYTSLNLETPYQYLYAIAFIPLIFNIKRVYLNKEPVRLDPELKKVALSTFLFAILFSLLH